MIAWEQLLAAFTVGGVIVFLIISFTTRDDWSTHWNRGWHAGFQVGSEDQKHKVVDDETVIIAKMKGCPFCGGKSLSFFGLNNNRVRCDNCKAVGPSVLQCPTHKETLRESASRWNKREKAGRV